MLVSETAGSGCLPSVVADAAALTALAAGASPNSCCERADPGRTDDASSLDVVLVAEDAALTGLDATATAVGDRVGQAEDFDDVGREPLGRRVRWHSFSISASTASFASATETSAVS